MAKTSTHNGLKGLLHHEAAGGVLLFIAAVVALVWANSPWSDAYFDLWAEKITIGTGSYHLSESLLHWINDGLMAIFFFVVGLEIKREVMVGELASPKRAALPAIAALGGVVVPAALYLVLNAGQPGENGWGIPMATDIAFVVGILAILGNRIPLGLKVFLTALAIVDDIVAVLVIAVFYTAHLEWAALGIAAVILALVLGANIAGLRHPFVYTLLGLGLWVAVLESGVHATIAGVLLAMLIPARTRFNPDELVAEGRRILNHFDKSHRPGESILTNGDQQEALVVLEDLVEGAGAPLQRMERSLHSWVAFLIVPLFALANAGVAIDMEGLDSRVTLGIILGLVVGKLVGISVFSFAAVKSGMTDLPRGVTWSQVVGASCLAGIGFTMSLFVTDLAFGNPEDDLLRSSAKVGILAASLVAGTIGCVILSRNRNREILG